MRRRRWGYSLSLLPRSPRAEPTRILKQPEYRVVQRGMSALFECKVKHDPSLIPTMTWLKDNGELPDHERYGPREVVAVLVGVRWRIQSHHAALSGSWLAPTP